MLSSNLGKQIGLTNRLDNQEKHQMLGSILVKQGGSAVSFNGLGSQKNRFNKGNAQSKVDFSGSLYETAGFHLVFFQFNDLEHNSRCKPIS